MPFYLSDIIGDGSEVDERRPATELIGGGHAFCYESNDAIGKVLVKSDQLPADTRWTELDTMLVETMGVPTDGLTTDEDLAQATARRFLLRQMLEDDDLPGLGDTFGNIPEAQRLRIKLRLAGVDMRSIRNTMSVREASKIILPQLNMPKAFGSKNKPAPSGTFTDNFTDVTDPIDLDDHTPSGGTAWTRSIRSSAGDGSVTGGQLVSTSTNTHSMYWCDDQGDEDSYIKFKWISSGIGSGLGILRSEIGVAFNGSWIGVSVGSGSKVKIFTKFNTTFVQIGPSGLTTVNSTDEIKMEASGNSLEAFINDVSETSGTSSFNNTETRQGTATRQAFTIDDFEAGVLAVAGIQVLRRRIEGYA